MAADTFTTDDYGGFARRLVAWVLDSIALLLAYVVALLVLAVADGGELSLGTTGMIGVLVPTWLLWEVAWIAGPSRGKPGQLATGMRVVRTNGDRVSLPRVLARWATKLLGVVTYGLYPLGCALTIARTPRRQALHDLVAGSVCVRTHALERIGSVQHAGSITAAPTSEPGAVELSSHRGPFL